MKFFLALYATVTFAVLPLHAQIAWPSANWTSAVNQTPLLGGTGILELSGLHWNSQSQQLFAVQNNGRVRVLQRNSDTGNFSQICNKAISGGPEGITQADLTAQEFYVVDEDNYQVSKYVYTAGFGSVTLVKHWNLLAAPSPMTNTGNTGPEGIVFIPDENLAAGGFVGSVSGLPYTSVKGAGGLFFIASQNGGYIWVFDINPDVDDDFAYVGKYRSSRNESCDLSFDRTTNLLYVLHNTGSNYLQVCALSPGVEIGGEAALSTVNEYFITNTIDGNNNIEGFAMMPKCPNGESSAWLCRDVESSESPAISQDALRFFENFAAEGTCGLDTQDFPAHTIAIAPNPVHNTVSISFSDAGRRMVSVMDLTGKLLIEARTSDRTEDITVGSLPSGFYIVRVEDASSLLIAKFLKI